MGIGAALIALLIFAADVWAILRTTDSDTSIGNKTMWCVLILVLPVLGLVLWAIAGPKGAAA